MCDLKCSLLLCHNLLMCDKKSQFLRGIECANIRGNGVKTGRIE